MMAHLGSTPVNVLDVLFRNKEAVALYRGSTLLQNFGESGSKLQADFTTGTYKASGAAKTFADLFTFTRAGKAWLVKETGLQEYEADVPRLDDGLLIEQSATNISRNISGYAIRAGATKEQLDDGYTRFNQGATGDGLLHAYPPYLLDTTYMYSLYVRAVINADVTIITQSRPSLNPEQSHTLIALEKKLLTLGLTRSSAAGATHLGLKASSIDVLYAQLELGDRVTSPVITDTTPVTRPADFLLNKITGTTVTGDWDSTLNLSIVNGNLVHSGYGRIRSLEIN